MSSMVLRCEQCERTFQTHNSQKRHVKRCQAGLVAAMSPEQRSLLGNWYRFKAKSGQTVFCLRADGEALLHRRRTYATSNCGPWGVNTTTLVGGKWRLLGDNQIEIFGEAKLRTRCACGLKRLFRSKFRKAYTLDRWRLLYSRLVPQTCRNCNAADHLVAACPTLHCFRCGGAGHFARSCTAPEAERRTHCAD